MTRCPICHKMTVRSEYLGENKRHLWCTNSSKGFFGDTKVCPYDEIVPVHQTNWLFWILALIVIAYAVSGS